MTMIQNLEKAQGYTLKHNIFTLIKYYQSLKNEQQMCSFAYEKKTYLYKPSPS